MKRALIILALVTTLATAPIAVHATDVGPLFTTPLLGISLGSMAGFMAGLTTGDPGEHTGYIGIGAGIGLLAGLALGISGMEDASAGFYRKDSGRENILGFSVFIPLQ